MSNTVYCPIARASAGALLAFSADGLAVRGATLLDQLKAALAADDPQLDVALRTGGNRRAPRRTRARMEVAFFTGLTLLAVRAFTALFLRAVGHIRGW